MPVQIHVDSLYMCRVRVSLPLPWQGQKNAGVENNQPPTQYSQSGSHHCSQQSPPGSPAALKGKSDKYQTFSFSDKEGESDVDEQIQLIESEHGLGDGRVAVIEETSKDSDLQSKPENVCFHHHNYCCYSSCVSLP